jgi:hypothetical protein
MGKKKMMRGDNAAAGGVLEHGLEAAGFFAPGKKAWMNLAVITSFTVKSGPIRAPGCGCFMGR